ncbi:unnamed protein product [Anisakis simplex]|uniref:MFS domain-containing protein n=1 Tax=Anisakis simplex TaxID=6269 RepID=A0A0M3JVZ2_ANISI|nr:unnamed protein product [Anisakis simplex]
MAQMRGPVERTISEEDVQDILKRQRNEKWFCYALQLFNGIQFSVLAVSMWPFLKTIDARAEMVFYGWVVAMFPFGQTFGSMLFQYAYRKRGTMYRPVATAFLLMGIAHALYVTLPLYASGKWEMLVTRFIFGLGAGNMSVVRANIRSDRIHDCRWRKVSIDLAMFMLGLTIGPVIAVLCAFLKQKGFMLGILPVTMYNLPAFLMVILSCVVTVVALSCFDVNDRRSIPDEISDFGEPPVPITLPCFDRLGAAVCVAIWLVIQCVAVNIEVLMVPFSIALYNWDDQQALFYDGLILFGSTMVMCAVFVAIGFKKTNNYDGRKAVCVGLILMLLYHLFMIPWPFYPSHYPEPAVIKAHYSGVCPIAYDWCSSSTIVPLPVFIVLTIVLLGFGFAIAGEATGTLFSAILGPIHLEAIQILFDDVGNLGRCAMAVISTVLFEKFGYFIPMVIQCGLIALALIATLICRQRLVRMELPSPQLSFSEPVTPPLQSVRESNEVPTIYITPPE